MLASSLLLWRVGKRLERRQLLFLALPPTIYFLAMLLLRVNVGVRYLVPLYPFVFLLCSRVATFRFSGAPAALCGRLALLALPIALSVGSSLAVAPHQLAYPNCLAGGPEGGSAYLGDSNLDWGQDLENLQTFLGEEQVAMIYLSYFGTAPPESCGIRHQFLPGIPAPLRERPADLLPLDSSKELLAISVNNLQGIYLANEDLYHWLHAYSPIAKIGYSIRVYDLTDDAAAHRRPAGIYRQVGTEKHAEAEKQRTAKVDSDQSARGW